MKCYAKTLNLYLAFNSQTVPACAWDSKTMIDASSRLIDVDRWDRAGMWSSSSNTNSNSSCVRSWDLEGVTNREISFSHKRAGELSRVVKCCEMGWIENAPKAFNTSYGDFHFSFILISFSSSYTSRKRNAAWKWFDSTFQSRIYDSVPYMKPSRALNIKRERKKSISSYPSNVATRYAGIYNSCSRNALHKSFARQSGKAVNVRACTSDN